jgi:hypothetical protein
LAFAHLLDAAPMLDLTHVEVIREAPETRLAARISSPPPSPPSAPPQANATR